MNNIEQIIANKILGNPLDDAQKECLQQWIDKNPKNSETYKRICRGESASLILEQDNSNLGDRMSLNVKNTIRRKKKYKIFKMAVASSAAIIIVSFYFMFVNQDMKKDSIANVEFENPVMEKKPTNNNSIMLITSQGEEVFVDKTVKIDSVINNIKENSSKKDSQLLVAFNTIIVPSKMEYELDLPDGTKVWLNSNSKLVFPSQFCDSVRIVELIGEAFFDVAKDEKKPFIVKTKMLETKVLGTKFMVNSYANSNCEVALVEGKVNVLTATLKQNLILKPGKGVSYDLQKNEYNVIDIDIENILSRRNGFFLFDNITLESITEIMKNWYGVDFKFADENSKKEIFYLKSIKYENIEDVLLLLKDTKKINYTVNNNVVTIKSFMPMK